MKIMFVIDCNLSGGAERVVSILTNYFDGLGHQVTLLNFDCDSGFYPINPGVELIKLARKYPQIDTASNKISRKLQIIKKTRQEILLHRPDIVIPFLFDAEFAVIPLCVMHKIPCITSVRNDAEAYPRFQRFFRRIFYPRISGVVFQSKAVMQHDDYCGLRNACVIPNPITMQLQEKRELAINNDKIISVGRLTEQKNHEMTIRVMSKIVQNYPQVKLHIFGEGKSKESIQRLIEELNLTNHVFLDGVVENAQYLNRDACAFVMASNYEGFPNALLEAMACHIPAICTNFNSGTAAEALLGGDAGWLVEVGSDKELEAAILECLSDPLLAEQKADKAVRHCRDYGVDVIGRRWLEFIVSVGHKQQNES